MPDHERDRRPLLLGEGEELGRNLAQCVSVEGCNVCNPEAEEN